MDRREFCDILTKRREFLGLSWLKFAFAQNSEPSSLSKIVCGKSNFWVETIIPIAKTLGLVIVLSNDKEEVTLDSPDKIAGWAAHSYAQMYMSVSKFVTYFDMSRVALTDNLKGKSRMRIDTFLKWAEVTGYTVDLRPIA